MRYPLTALLLVSMPALGSAQVLPGDLLLNSFHKPEVLVHYRPDGTVVQTTGSGTGQQWTGAAILPDGNWLTLRRQPYGVNIFDGITGAEIASWDYTGFSLAGDVDVFSDGTIAIVDQAGRVWRFDISGNLIASWSVSTNPFGILVDEQDHVWTCDVVSGVLWHTDDQGNKLDEFSVGGRAGDVTMAMDGTLFVTRRHTGEVAHYTQDGTFLGAFLATGNSGTEGIALAADQTLWVTGESETKLFHFDQAGTLLGSFDLAAATVPVFLSIHSTGRIGTNYCGPAKPNSTNQAALISAFGTASVGANLLTLTASQLPPDVFGYFLNSNVQDFVPMPPGSQGNLCLGGAIGRHVTQVGKSDAAGELAIDVDLTALPRPNGTYSVMGGETWNFQCWFRDSNPGPTSNFTDAVSVTFF